MKQGTSIKTVTLKQGILIKTVTLKQGTLIKTVTLKQGTLIKTVTLKQGTLIKTVTPTVKKVNYFEMLCVVNYHNLCDRIYSTADCKIIGTGPAVFNGFCYQYTTRKSLKTFEKVSIILQGM